MSVSTVSATGIQDPTGQVFANGTWQLYFTPTYATPGPFTDGGVVFTRIYSGTLDATGSFSQAGVNRNDTISPAGSRWKLIVTPAAPSASTEILINVNAPAVDVTAAINALIQPIQVGAQGLPRAYKDAELNNPNGAGAIYYDETLKQLKVWDPVSGIWIATPVNGSSPTFNNLTVTGIAAIGTAPVASVGTIRLPQGGSIQVRNSTDTTDQNMASSNGANGFNFGANNEINTSGVVTITASGAARFLIPRNDGVFNTLVARSDGVYSFSSTTGLAAPDTGVSRAGVDIIAIGNGTQGDASGQLNVHTLNLTDVGTIQNATTPGNNIQVSSSNGIGVLVGGAEQFRAVSGATFFSTSVRITQLQILQWGSAALTLPDVGLSRIGAGVLALGNSALGDFSGNLKIGNGAFHADTLRIGADNNGFWAPSPGAGVAIEAAGIDVASFSTAALTLGSGKVLGWSSAAGATGASADTGLSRTGATTIALGNGTASDASGTLALANIKTGAGTSLAVPATGANVISDTATQTISNKRITKRAVAQADATSITVNSDITDIATQVNTQIAGTLTLNAPTGTPTEGQPLLIRIKSTNAQTYSFNAVFRFSTTTVAPTGITAGKVDLLAFVWNATDSKWDVAGVNQGH